MNRLVTIAFVVMSGLAASSVEAQQAAPDLSVSGLKLGMTVDEAKAALLQHDPATQFVTTNAFLSKGALTEWSETNTKAAPPPGTFTAPVEIVAGTVQHAYALNHHEIPPGVDDLVYDVAGEWYDLHFTPNDNGGSLYAIIRGVLYPYEAVDRATLPAIAPFLDEVTKAYGKPSAIDNSKRDLEWAFDNRGRLLSGTSPQFQRCEMATLFPQSVQLRGANSDVSTVHGKDLAGAEGVEIGAGFLPYVSGTDEFMNNRAQYRKCGVGMQVTIQSTDMAHIENFIIFLADFDKTFFDDGVEAYLKSKSAPVTATATPKL